MRWVLASLSALAIVGLVAVIVVGFPQGPTEVVPTPQTLPPERDITTTTSPLSDASFPDGSPAPDGVSEVLVADRSTSLSFRMPDGLDASTLAPAVAPVRTAVVDDGAAISVGVECARSADEVLAQISVSETDGTISVLAVVLVPDDGAPCQDPPADVASVEVPLLAEVGGRTIDAIPPGTPVPELDPAA